MLAGIALSSTASRAERFDFAFGKGAFRENEIFDSANAPPARYLIEVARRMIRHQPEAEVLAIGNPLLPLAASQVADYLKGVTAVPTIVTDANKFPLVYVLPRKLVDDYERFLLLLSTCDAVADAKLISAMTGQQVIRLPNFSVSIDSFPVSTTTGWFMGKERQKVLKLLCAKAIDIVEGNPDWRNLPFASYQPYHAGSVLFFNIASQDVEDSFFQRQIICSSYKDIWAASKSRQEPIWLRLPFLPRDNSVGELEYLVHSLERLGEKVVAENFIVWMRYSRVYSVAPFHLIDQLKFALGDSMLSEDRTIHGQPPRLQAKSAEPARPLKLLFHLTGGWKLKTYPDDHTAELFRALQAVGCEVTVIDRPELESLGVKSITADETALLTQATEGHHLFIGVDSFPHHFVRNVLGWPTIGLFANTKPCNSDAKAATDYRALVGSMPCNPCGGHDQCPVFGRDDCTNFVEPRHIISAIFDMAHELYGFSL